MLFKLGIFLIVTVSCFSNTESKSYDVCPNEEEARFLIASAWIGVPAVERTTLVRRLRLPQEGLFDETITCLFITDTSSDDSGGGAEIVDGGINHRYVEIRLNSQIGKELDFIVMAYSEHISTPIIDRV